MLQQPAMQPGNNGLESGDWRCIMDK